MRRVPEECVVWVCVKALKEENESIEEYIDLKVQLGYK